MPDLVDERDKMTQRIKIVVGLGNPGRQYAMTRHNVGSWCVKRLARQNSITFSCRYRQVALGEGCISGQLVALVKPRTFVNDTGRAVIFLLEKYSGAIDDLLLVYDEMNLAPGSIRVRAGGSSGGHNGMKSIISAVGTEKIARVRIGIGRPSSRTGDIEHVLGRLPPDEKEKVDLAVQLAAKAVNSVVCDGVEAAMNQFNQVDESDLSGNV